MTKEITKRKTQLPSKIDDLVKMSYIQTEYFKLRKAKVRSLKKFDASEEEREKALKDAQDSAILLLEVEAKIGELLESFDKKIISKGKHGFVSAYPDCIAGAKHARKRRQAKAIYNNPKAVKAVIKEAIQNEDIPTKTAIINKIKTKKKVKKIITAEKYIEDISETLTDCFQKLNEMSEKGLKLSKDSRKALSLNISNLSHVIKKLPTESQSIFKLLKKILKK